MSLGQDVLARLPRALAHEWRLTNGLGGHAAGNAAFAVTRSLHACLVAHARGVPAPSLVRLDERAVSDDGSFDLGCVVQSNGAARPAGHRLLERFSASPWPIARYRLGRAVIEKSLLLIHGHDAAVVAYRHAEGPPVRLTIGPVLGWRGATPRADAEPPRVHAIPGRIRIDSVEGSPELTLWHGGAYLPGRAWTRDPGEASALAFLPGVFESTVTEEAPLLLVVSTENDLFRALAREARLGATAPHTLGECVAALEIDERTRVAVSDESARCGALLTAREAAAARQLDPDSAAVEPSAVTTALARGLLAGVVRRGTRLSILGALPGAPEQAATALRAVLGLLAIRRFELAREVIAGHLEFASDGRVPERYDDAGAPVYGDPEASLWLVIAGERYVRRSGDQDFGRSTLYPALEELMRFCRAGAPGGPRVDVDGLLETLADGEDGPCRVKRADLNALWYHASVAMSQLARGCGRRENAAFYLAWAHEHQQRYIERFADPVRGGLYAELRDGLAIGGCSAPQLHAVSLSPALLPRELAASLLERLQGTLVTPFGLRESPASDVVRPEWLGMWHAARIRVDGRSADTLAAARAAIEDACARMALETPGHLPERCRPGAEETPDLEGRASPLAAAALLRVWVEDLDHARKESEVSA